LIGFYLNSKKFIFLILTLLIFNFKSFSDESSDSNNKKKINYVISHYSCDEYNTFFDNEELYSFKKITELDLTCKFNFLPWYSFLFYFNNIFEFDFYEIYRLYDFKKVYDEYWDNNSIYNTFTFELSNEFSIKKIIQIDLNFDFINEVSSNKKEFSYNRYLSLSVVPWINLSGDYYFGYFWDLRAYQFFEFFPQEDYKKFITFSYLQIGYQFFRFYGPKKFKFSILLGDKFYYNIPTKYVPSSINNIFRFGLKFNFFNFEPFLYYMHDFYYSLYKDFDDYNNNSFGINFGFKYTIENFTVGAEYIGTYDILRAEYMKKYNIQINDSWVNDIDFYFKFNIWKIY